MTTKREELLSNQKKAWDEINAILNKLTDAQMIEIKDAEGWAIKDHITHLIAWQNSIIACLQHHPRYLGLKIEKELYINQEYDEMNDVIFKQNSKYLPKEVVSRFQDSNKKLLAELNSISESDLNEIYNKFNPDELKDERPVWEVINSNTANHIKEHIPWINEIIKKKSYE
jgi:hypothetical protein